MLLADSTISTQAEYKLLTFEQIAELTGLSKIAVFKRKGIDKYIQKTVSNGGRPRVYLHPDVLEMFGIKPATNNMILHANNDNQLRKGRNDKDKARKVDESDELEFVELAKKIYLAQANRKYVLNACHSAAMQLWNEKWAKSFKSWLDMAEYFYKQRLMRKTFNFTGYAVEYPSWIVQWEAKWKKTDRALKRLPTMKYSWLEIAEDAGFIGEGYGAATIWVLDDHSSDSFMYDAERKGYSGSLVKGLFVFDAITHNILDFIEGEVNSIMVVMAILRNVVRYGLPHVICLENSKVMKNIKIDGAIKSLYSKDTLLEYASDNANWFHTIFPKGTTPIVRNLPNIPRAAFKPVLERMFQDIKAHDGVAFPRTFTGGGTDQVQLKISNMPAKPGEDYTIQAYTESMIQYLKTEYMDKIRPKLYKGFNKVTGLLPTVRNVWNYYGGSVNPGSGIAPDASRFAECLYFISKMQGSPLVFRETKCKAGFIDCTVDGVDYTFVNSKLARFEGQKLAIVFVPDGLMGEQRSELEYAAIFRVKKEDSPEFIDILRDNRSRDVATMNAKRKVVQDARKEMKIEVPQGLGVRGQRAVKKTLVTNVEIKQLPAPAEPGSLKTENKIEEYDSDIQSLLDL